MINQNYVSLLRRNDMRDICSDYENDRCVRELKNKEAMWEFLFKFKNLLNHNKSDHSFNIFNAKLYRSLFKLEKQRFVSRPNFLLCLRNLKDHELRVAVNLYNSFDIYAQHKFDWRAFAFMMYVSCNPECGCKDYLKKSYKYFIGSISLDINSPCDRQMRLKDLPTIIDPLIRPDRKEELLKLFDEAWCTTSKISLENIINDLSMEKGSIVLSYQTFERMIEQPILSIKMKRIQNRGQQYLFSSWSSTFEDRFYPVSLLIFLKKHRKANSCMRYILSVDKQIKYNSLAQWQVKMRQRQRTRKALHKLSKGLEYRLLKCGFSKIIKNAITIIAITEIQRTGRVFVGRLQSKMINKKKYLVIAVQALVRGFIQKRLYFRMILKRHWSMIKIQRNIRGYFHRRVAKNIRLTIIDKEHLRLAEKQISELTSRRACSAKVLQYFFRRVVSKKRGRVTIQRIKREYTVYSEIEQCQSAYMKGRKIFEQQLENYYNKERDKWYENNATIEHTLKEGVKVRILRRQIFNNEQRRQKEKQELEQSNRIETHQQSLISHWRRKGKERCVEFKKYCWHCLQSPDTPEEFIFAKTIKKRIKKRFIRIHLNIFNFAVHNIRSSVSHTSLQLGSRISDVLRRADVRKLKMEYPEARRITGKEVIYIMGEEESERVYNEMEQEFHRIKEDEYNQSCEQKKYNIKQKVLDKKHAVLIIALVARQWLARKSLRLLCYDRYEKLFHEEKHAFYYKDVETGNLSWDKPKSLGKEYDITPKDEWKVLRDSQGFPYYYNPFSMYMSWNHPPEYQMCQQIVCLTWLRKFPLSRGPCEYFANHFTFSKGVRKGFCERCWKTDIIQSIRNR